MSAVGRCAHPVAPSLQGFSLSTVKHLVLDEADRLLNMDFEVEINQILKHAPRDRRTQLFSATMTTKVWPAHCMSTCPPHISPESQKLQGCPALTPARFQGSSSFYSAPTERPECVNAPGLALQALPWLLL